MSADVGFTPGKLIEAAQAIEPIADPFSQSMSTMGEELTTILAGLNGPYIEFLDNALGKWADSLGVLYEDLSNLADALVGVERFFEVCEGDIIDALLDAGSGFSPEGGDGSGGKLYYELQQLSTAGDEGGAE